MAAACTPPPSNPEYIAPRLPSPAYNEALRAELEILRWQPGTDTSGAIKVYAVEVWKGGTKPIGAGWTRDSSFELAAIAKIWIGDGSQFWHDVVVEVEGGRPVSYLFEPSESRQLIW